MGLCYNIIIFTTGPLCANPLRGGGIAIKLSMSTGAELLMCCCCCCTTTTTVYDYHYYHHHGYHYYHHDYHYYHHDYHYYHYLPAY